MAQPGFEWKEIPFVIELEAQGNPIQIEDTRGGEGKKIRARSFLVPQGVKKTSGVAANLLWDNAAYVLGVDTKGKPKRVEEQRQAFIAKIESLSTAARNDIGVQAVLNFLRQASPIRSHGMLNGKRLPRRLRISRSVYKAMWTWCASGQR